MQVNDIFQETTHGTSLEVSVDTEAMIIMGKVGNSGKAPPVLAKLKSEKEAKHVLSNATKLAKGTGVSEGICFSRLQSR